MSEIFWLFWVVMYNSKKKKKVCQTNLENGNSVAKKDKLSKVRMN